MKVNYDTLNQIPIFVYTIPTYKVLTLYLSEILPPVSIFGPKTESGIYCESVNWR